MRRKARKRGDSAAGPLVTKRDGKGAQNFLVAFPAEALE
jgi:hypothetical protein